MAALRLVGLESTEGNLIPDPYITKGQEPPPPPSDQIGSRLLVGGPICLAAEAAIVDGQDLDRVIAAESGRYEFHVIHTACTFQPGAGETVAPAPRDCGHLQLGLIVVGHAPPSLALTLWQATASGLTGASGGPTLAAPCYWPCSTPSSAC